MTPSRARRGCIFFVFTNTGPAQANPSDDDAHCPWPSSVQKRSRDYKGLRGSTSFELLSFSAILETSSSKETLKLKNFLIIFDLFLNYFLNYLFIYFFFFNSNEIFARIC